MRYTVPAITTNTDTEATTIIRRNDADFWEADVFTSGTFGGTTVTLQVSPDGGTTKFPVNTTAGTAYSLTAAGYGRIRFAGSSQNNTGNLVLYVRTAGGAGASINVVIVDNR